MQHQNLVEQHHQDYQRFTEHLQQAESSQLELSEQEKDSCIEDAQRYANTEAAENEKLKENIEKFEEWYNEEGEEEEQLEEEEEVDEFEAEETEPFEVRRNQGMFSNINRTVTPVNNVMPLGSSTKKRT